MFLFKHILSWWQKVQPNFLDGPFNSCKIQTPISYSRFAESTLLAGTLYKTCIKYIISLDCRKFITNPIEMKDNGVGLEKVGLLTLCKGCVNICGREKWTWEGCGKKFAFVGALFEHSLWLYVGAHYGYM
jgi:hypothetical protein